MACISPTRIKSPLNNGKFIYVPCGKCAWCRKAKRNEWCLRFEVEQRENMFTDFITLTYDEQHVPYYIDEEDGVFEMRASKADVQKFIKRLRKQGYKFKYFIVSELGPKEGRPHYHGIFFSNEKIKESDIQEKWNKGFTSSYPASPGAMRYVTKYILKGNDRNNNFMLCSKRPAIGASYVKYQTAIDTYRKTDDGVYAFSMPVVGGKLCPMPRNYKKKMKTFIDEVDFEINQIRLLHMMEERPKQYYLEKKYKEGGITNEQQIEFNNLIENNYLKDLKQQYKINKKGDF